MAIAIQQPAVVITRDITTSQELSDAISAPGSEPLMGPIRIEGSDLTSLERAKVITRDFITQALTVVLGLESGSQLRASAEVRGLDRSEIPYIEFSYELPLAGRMIGKLAEGGLLRADKLSDGTIVVDLNYGGLSYFYSQAASSIEELAVARPSGDTFIKEADGTVFLVSSYGAERLVGGKPVIVTTDRKQKPVSTLSEGAVVVQMKGGTSGASFIQPPHAAEKIAELLQNNDSLRDHLVATGHWTARMVLSGPSGSATHSVLASGTPQRNGARNNNMETDVATVVGGNNRFALDLYARLRTEQSGNLFFSPSSISTALAMTYAGARGDTESEMAKVLHFTLPQDKLHPGFASLNKTLDGNGEKRGYRLHGANRLWGQQGYGFLPEFLTTTRTHYDAELAEVDFVRQTEQARKQINTWVEERTQGKIKELITPDILDASTCLVLTNAIYFKGDWTKPFDNKVTKDAPFQITSQQRTDVPMMHQQGDFRYWAGDGLKILELPYGRGDLSMLVLLPAETGGLPDLEARLTSENLCRWLMNVREQPVRVFLPRFKLTSQFRLNDTLKAMGMLLAFGRADFSGMNGKRELFISAVIHKAFVDVNEEGTEAAAATAVIMSRGLAIPRQPAEFRADHPFVFLIRDNRTGSILFLGRLMNPTE